MTHTLQTPAEILTHVDAGVMTLTLNRLERKNSITSAMYGAMADALESANHDVAVRAVVIQGHETIFSAGNDIGDFLKNPPATAEAPVFRFLRGISSFPKPIVAAVCGPAVGIGTTMLLHCDLVYAGDNAAFCMPFVNLGLCPEAASSFLAAQLMGYPRAAEALLLGEPFMAETAPVLAACCRSPPRARRSPPSWKSASRTSARSEVCGRRTPAKRGWRFRQKRRPDFSNV